MIFYIDENNILKSESLAALAYGRYPAAKADPAHTDLSTGP